LSEPAQTTPEPPPPRLGEHGVKGPPLVVKGLKCLCKGRVTGEMNLLKLTIKKLVRLGWHGDHLKRSSKVEGKFLPFAGPDLNGNNLLSEKLIILL